MNERHEAMLMNSPEAILEAAKLEFGGVDLRNEQAVMDKAQALKEAASKSPDRNYAAVDRLTELLDRYKNLTKSEKALDQAA